MESKSNWRTPCLNRDHQGVLSPLIAKHEPEPIDESAHEALLDPNYEKGLKNYGELYEELSEPIWHDQYLNGRIRQDSHDKRS